MPYCVGLTGGIGSGKSSAARMFAALGAGVVDVDDISHALTQPGGAAIAAIRTQFVPDAIATSSSASRWWIVRKRYRSREPCPAAR